MDAICAIIGLASLIYWIRTRHPFFCLPLLVAGSLLLEDDAYPFSHFPMYSDPDGSENYLYLATPDAEVEGGIRPLAVRTLTGLTAPKIKKMFKTYLKDYAKERGKRDKELSPEERAEVGRQILAYYREQGELRRSEMPEPMLLMEVWIEYDEDKKGFTETLSEVARILDTDSGEEENESAPPLPETESNVKPATSTPQ